MTQTITELLPKLTKLANHWYAYYGGPVFLIGSALEKEEPRDIDIRVVVTKEDFERLYGKYEDFSKEYVSGEFGPCTWSWVEDRLKRCRLAYAETNANIDFCVFTRDMWDTTVSKMRLDTRNVVCPPENKNE